MHLLPTLLIIGLVGLLAAPVLVLMSRPGGGGSPLDRLSRRKKSPATPKPPRKDGTP
jgi:hypothetical protein